MNGCLISVQVRDDDVIEVVVTGRDHTDSCFARALREVILAVVGDAIQVALHRLKADNTGVMH